MSYFILKPQAFSEGNECLKLQNSSDQLSMKSVKATMLFSAIPAEAGIHRFQASVDSAFAGVTGQCNF
jgi:hypothetical protein